MVVVEEKLHDEEVVPVVEVAKLRIEEVGVGVLKLHV